MMDAAWMRFRAELRQRWRGLVALVLLAGIPAGVAVAAASGAARTDSVIDRLVAETRPPLIYVTTYFQQTKLAFEDVAGLPVVSESILFHGYGNIARGTEDLELGATVDVTIPADRTHLLSGRLPRADHIEEATINFHSVQRYKWKLGDVVPLQLAAVGSDFVDGDPIIPGPKMRATIVGITADPGDFVGIAGPGMTFGPGFDRTYGPMVETFDLYMFSLQRGSTDIPAFNKGLNSLTGGDGVLVTDGRSGIAQVRRVFRLNGAALWVLSLSLGLVTALIFTQAFARQTLLQSAENTTMRALGMTSRDLLRVALARAGTIALGAAAVIAITAAALSPIFPLGTPGIAEPHPGVSLPAATFVGGIAAAAALIFVLATAASVLGDRMVAGGASMRRVAPSALARLVSRVTRRPAPAIGARFALEPGRGAAAVPIRTSLTAAVTGIVALLAALTAGASLHHLLETPSLYGVNWDLELPGDFTPGSRDVTDLTADPAVAAASAGVGGEGAAFEVTYGKRSATMNGINVDAIKGHLGPRLISGKTPAAAEEIALGPRTLDTIHARLGNVVRVRMLGVDRESLLRVVGEAVLPFDDDSTGIGEGLWTTHSAMRMLDPRVPRESALVRFAPGVDRDATVARLTERFQGEELNPIAPRTIRSLGRMSNLSVGLAALLAALAAGTLAHLLTTSIRRRRRDLAILRTMGFSSGQVRSAVGWQAIVFVSVALAISIPIGIIIGRWTWQLIAQYGGFAAAPVVPAAQILLVGLSALASAVLLAALPARSAARTRPALVLRSE